MASYHFRAMDGRGQIRQGVRHADSQAALARDLSAEGLVLLRLHDRDAGGWRGLLSREIGGPPRLASTARAALLNEMVMLLRAGLRLDQALDLLADAAGQGWTKAALERAVARLRGGEALAAALAEPELGFSAIELTLIGAGERSGAVAAVLAELASHLERVAAIRDRLVQALIYPALLIVMTLVILGLLITVVVPRFTPLFAAAGANLPPLTRFVRDFSHAAADGMLPAAVLLALTVLAVVQARRRAGPRLAIDRRLLHVPLIGGLVARRGVARWCRTLATLLRGGLTIDKALAAAHGVTGNAALDGALHEAGTLVAAGQPLWRAIDRTGHFTAVTVHMLRIGEESSSLGPMLLHVAEREEAQLAKTLERFTTLLTPAITLVMGVVVAVVIWAVMSAILGLNQLL